MHDAIVIGSGIGGLTCAAKLAARKKDVLVLEKMSFVGGTCCTFERKGYRFPMGALSFSHPGIVKDIFQEIGVQWSGVPLSFKRSHFQLISPDIDIVYSQPVHALKGDLTRRFPGDAGEIEHFFSEFGKIVDLVKDIHEWHPDYQISATENGSGHPDKSSVEEKVELVKQYEKIPIREMLDKYIKNDCVARLIGSQGTYRPKSTALHAAFSWNIMSEIGIWFPSSGIDGLVNSLNDFVISAGGKILPSQEVVEIIVKNGRATGVRMANGNVHESRWIVCNTCFKQAILEMIRCKHVDSNYRERVTMTPYAGSELCVYLGIDPLKADLSRMRADHLFYRSAFNDSTDPAEFKNKEIEICNWSNKSADFAPRGRACLTLRVGMPFSYFKKWWDGTFKRKAGYKEIKQELTWKLIDTVEEVIPGLRSSMKVMESATPLTYHDFTSRRVGSLAGWTRNVRKIHLDQIHLTPGIQNLLFTGLYSTIDPYLGGLPISVATGNMAAGTILDSPRDD